MRTAQVFSAFLLVAAMLLSASPAWTGEESARPAPGRLGFGLVEPGLELAQTSAAPTGHGAPGGLHFTILRIDPKLHEFVLCMASEEGRPLSLPGWSLARNLRAGINASMYLPDGITSTGCMRNGTSINNGRCGERLGAFFVAGPAKAELPNARILERNSPGMPALLDDYTVVVQNFRFMDSRGNLLWRSDTPVYSMAAVAEDEAGHILFIHCREPVQGEVFAVALKEFSLSLRTVMYVEGGAQAGLFLRLDALDNPAQGELPQPQGSAYFPLPGGGGIHTWKGMQSIINTLGNPQAPVPNVIGIRRRNG
ncbi:MAG: phosphodiester glycosidase family protein [Desulfovibrio sp.]|nr:phosphodiester glycosidase family protein [Desulfovibrio sp.]